MAVPNGHTSGFHRYFSELATSRTSIRDVGVMRQRMLDDTTRLFKNEIDLQVLWSSGNDDRRQGDCQVRGLNDLQRLWQEHVDHDFTYILSQAFTWDGLLIDRECLFQLLHQHHVFPGFLDCIHAYGSKLSDDQNSWTGLHQGLHSSRDGLTGSIGIELCYNVRYMFENGRSKGSSWSLRQMSVYQQQSPDTGAATWIFIRPSKVVQDWLQAQSASHKRDELHSFGVHLVALRQSADSWIGHISDLCSALGELDSKASFAKIGKKTFPDDYEVSLRDNQKLQKVQRKLFRARTTVEDTLQTVSRLQTLCKRISDIGVDCITCTPSLFDEIEDITATLESHRRTLKGLIAYSHGTASLLQQITSHRAMTDLQTTTTTLDTSLYLLRGIATISQTQSQSMLTLAQSGRKDSIRIKTLTHVATIYLPPTLIATVFSSNLVSTAIGSEHLVLSSQFWIFIVVTLVFTVVTIGGLFMLERRWSRDTIV